MRGTETAEKRFFRAAAGCRMSDCKRTKDISEELGIPYVNTVIRNKQNKRPEIFVKQMPNDRVRKLLYKPKRGRHLDETVLFLVTGTGKDLNLDVRVTVVVVVVVVAVATTDDDQLFLRRPVFSKMIAFYFGFTQ
jgi:hypothetical protein